MSGFLFVGEKPSRQAHEKGWTWESGRLAGKTLSEALAVVGVPFDRCGFVNLFGDDPYAPEGLTPLSVGRAKALGGDGRPVVALGNKVSSVLTTLGINHIRLIHPAARGAIRAKGRYIEHVRETLRA